MAGELVPRPRLDLSGVGGGSLIYNGIQAQPEDDYFDAFPAEISAADMRPFYDKVRAMQRPAPLPGGAESGKLFERAAAAAGLGPVEYPDLAVAWGNDPGRPETVVNAAGIEQRTSVHVDSTFWGCTDRSKTTLDLTYVPVALSHGAELRSLCEVTAIGPADGGYWARYTDHRVGQELHAEAPRLILSAGTLNTLRLLFAARDRDRLLPGLPPALGHHFSSNADMATILWRARAATEEGLGVPAGPFVRRRDDRGSHRFLVVHIALPAHDALPLPNAAIRKLEWLGVRTRRVPSPQGLFAGTVSFPPAKYESKPLDEQPEVPVATKRTASGEPGEGLQLVIGVRATEAGVSSARAVEVTYRVGDRQYRETYDQSVHLIRAVRRHPRVPPPEDENRFGDGVLG